MMKLKKSNNKGFSLVELIVVVLIIGILAVSLAPQVMKWVGTARGNSETKNQNSLVSTMQLAVADFMSGGGTVVASTLTITQSGATQTVNLTVGTNTAINMLSYTPPVPATVTLAESIHEVFGGTYLSPVDTTLNTYTITIEATTGRVTIVAS